MSDLLSVTTRQEADVDVVSFSGRMDASSAPVGEKALQDLIRGGHRHLILSGVALTYISSSGLRVLLAALKQLRSEGGDLRLAALTPAIRDVITMTGFNRIFMIYPTEQEAVASFLT